MNQHSLGDVVRQRRLELGLTQEQLAERISDHGGLKVRQSDISRLENNKITLPRRQRLEQIAQVLDLPLGELLARSGWEGSNAFFNGEVSEPLEDRGVESAQHPERARLERAPSRDLYREEVDGVQRLHQALGAVYEQQQRLERIKDELRETERSYRTEIGRRNSNSTRNAS